MTSDDLLAARRRLIGGNVSIGYRRPLHIVRALLNPRLGIDKSFA